ncbi:MAG: response regulator [bacterium]|nr:response regulator [bacterium]
MKRLALKRAGPEGCRAREMPRWLYGLLIALALLPRGVEAQPTSSFDEVGRFYVQNFAPEDYDAHAQSWVIAQGPDGLLYVANGEGVLEYDGVSWRLIPVSDRRFARSLAIGAEGRVFVGAVGELGYLAPDSLGRMRYLSLVDHIAPEDRVFSDVWGIEKTSDGLYFRTRERLFQWNGREMKGWRPETRFRQGFALGDVLYVEQDGIGLMRMDEDSLGMAPGGILFHDKLISGLVPQGEAAYLVITRDHGMFQCPAPRHSEAACTPFNPGLTDLLTTLQPYHATVVPEGGLAIATRRGGVVLLDPAGRLLRILNEASGLRDDSVKYSYVDRQGGLWLALNNGLARVETSAALSYWDKTTGLLGSVSEVARHHGRLYAATNLGVYVLESKAEADAPRFLTVPGGGKQCYSLLSTRQGMLAGCSDGVHNLDQRRLIWPHPGPVFSLDRSKRDPTHIYLGLIDGLARLVLRAGAWRDAGRIDGVHSIVQAIVEDGQGRLWMGTEKDGAIRIELAASPSDDPDARDPVVTRFGVADGLPAGWSQARIVAGRVRYLSDAGLFRLDSQPGSRQTGSRQTGSIRFVPDTTFDTFLPQGSRSIDGLAEDDQGRVWIAAGADSGVAHPVAEGGYTWASSALRRAPARDIYAMLAETDGPLWVASPHGLIRYDTNRSLDSATSYAVWIRRITTSAGSLLYDGRPGNLPTEWPYRDNTLRFAFAAPRYDAPERTHYRTRLDGLGRAATGDDWSAWVDETDKDYTNLWEGRYVFRVQARDVYGVVSREDTFAFRILPPWYRSWWAYSLYGLAFAAVVLFYLRYHRGQLRQAKEAADRERSISRRLREVDKLKDEFLANTSHELRTPLYGITGLAESLIDGAAGEASEAMKANLSMIVASGRRLGHLVNDILDFSKLRHKSLELDRRPVDLRALVDVVLTLSATLASSKNLRLENAVSPDLPAADADENRLQQILYNLIGNAIKFTEEGSVEVSAATEAEQLVVRVTDTGIGIPEGQQERIFDAFEQADASVGREHGGTGLGLAVSRRLVELHGGTIGLESAPGEGSTFSFSLPIAAAAAPAGAPADASRPAVERHPVREGEEPPTTDPVAPAESSSGGPRLLVVDDEPVNLQVVRNYLAVEEFQLTLAASGEEALRLLEEESFDLVLLDVMMPRISGYEVCRGLREKHSISDLPVIFLTAKTQDSDVVAGMALGANDYLTKPISRDRLLARVRPHLDLLHVHRNLEDLVEERMSQVRVLSGLLPICSGCKKIRDDEGYWSELELFIDRHSEAEFSHGICPECVERYYR